MVLTFKKQLENLEKVQEVCVPRVLPQAIEAAEKKIAAAEKRLSVPLPKDAPLLRQKQRLAQEKLEAARASLESGRQESRLGPIRHAAAETESIAETLAEIDRATARQSTDLLDVAEQQAERALTLAEREQQALKKALAEHAVNPQATDRASLEDVGRRLEALRQALPTAQRASDLTAVRQLRADADALRSTLERSRLALADTASSPVPEAPLATDDTEEIEPAATETTAPIESTPAESAPAERETQVDPTNRLDPSLIREIRRLTESAELFLDRVGADTSDSELLELQRSRLSDLVFEARGHSTAGSAAASALETLLGRLSDLAGGSAVDRGGPSLL